MSDERNEAGLRRMRRMSNAATVFLHRFVDISSGDRMRTLSRAELRKSGELLEALRVIYVEVDEGLLETPDRRVADVSGHPASLSGTVISEIAQVLHALNASESGPKPPES
jgi:hypothetical protein